MRETKETLAKASKDADISLVARLLHSVLYLIEGIVNRINLVGVSQGFVGGTFHEQLASEDGVSILAEVSFHI